MKKIYCLIALNYLASLFSLLSAQSFDWTKGADFPGTARSGAVSFVIGDTAYIGTGTNGTAYYNDFYKFDKTKGTWSQIKNFPGESRYGAVSFVLNGEAYVGTGYNNTSKYLMDFYKYNPIYGEWHPVADFGGSARYLAVAFSIGNKGFVGTGIDAVDESSNFYSYDPSNDSWTAVAGLSTSKKRKSAVGFSINNKGYIASGLYHDDYTTFIFSDVQEFDPSTNTWKEKVFADSKLSNKQGAAVFTMDNKAYLVGGSNTRSTILFDPSNSSLSTLAPIGPSTESKRSNPIAFSLGSIGYAGLGYNTIEKNDIWNYKEVAAPIAPSSLFVTTISKTSANIRWNDNSMDEDGFIIYLSEGDDQNFNVVTTVGANFISYGFTGLKEGTVYFAGVASKRGSVKSNIVSRRFVTLSDLPVAPSDLKLVQNNKIGMNLTWTNNASTRDGFIIERSINNEENFTYLNKVESWITSYSDTEFSETSGVVYYRVRAFKGTIESAHSNVAAGQIEDLKPVAPVMKIQSVTQLHNFVKHFNIYLGYTESLRTEKFYFETSKDNITFVLQDSGTFFHSFQWQINEMEKIYLRVIAKNNYGMDTSNILSAGPYLNSPEDLSPLHASAKIIGLQFRPDSRHEEATIIERKVNGGTFEPYDTLYKENYLQEYNRSFVYYYDSSIILNNTYEYRTYSIFEDLRSQYSGTVSITAQNTGSWKKYKGNGFSKSLDSLYLNGIKVESKLYSKGKIYFLSASEKHFFSYDMEKMTFSKLAGFPGSDLTQVKSFQTWGDKLVLTGYNDNGVSEDIWVFDTHTNTWQAETKLPQEVRGNLYQLHINPENENLYALTYYYSSSLSKHILTHLTYNSTSKTWSSIDKAQTSFGAIISYSTTDSIVYIGYDKSHIAYLKKENILSPIFFKATSRFSNDLYQNGITTYKNENIYINKGMVYKFKNMTNIQMKDYGFIDYEQEDWRSARKNPDGLTFTHNNKLYHGLSISSWSSWLDNIYFLDENAPEKPVNLHVIKDEGTSVEVAWFDVSDKEDSYLLQIKTYINSEWKFKNVGIYTSNTQKASIKNLEQDSHYNIRLAAITGQDTSAYSSLEFRTKRTVPYPAIYSAVAISASSVEISWELDNRIPASRLVLKDHNELSKELNILQNSAIINGLDENTSFSGFLENISEAGKSISYLQKNALTYLKTPGLENINYGNTFDGYMLRWEDVSRNESHYIIERKAADEEHFQIIDSVRANTTQYIDNPGTTLSYEYRIKAASYYSYYDGDKEIIRLYNTSAYSNVSSTNDKILGISKELPMYTKIYPNPASETLCIDTKEIIQEIRILSLEGKKLISLHALKGNCIDVKQLRKGIYIIKIFTGTGIVTEKIKIE